MQEEDLLAIERGLLIKDYPVKWKQAKSQALRADKLSYSEDSAFELACRFFLELGGVMQGNFYGILNSEKLNN